MAKAVKTYAPASREEQSAIVKSIGDRLREARELCNMTQSKAAQRLGYSNPSKLSKIEKASDTRSVPLWVIARAAKIYDVSVDFIFGLSSDWECSERLSQEREISEWMHAAWENARRRDMQIMKRLHDRVEAMNSAIAAMNQHSEDVKNALQVFIQKNPEFDDMLASNKLLISVNRAHDAALNARAQMRRFHSDCRLAAGESNQMSLLLLTEVK